MKFYQYLVTLVKCRKVTFARQHTSRYHNIEMLISHILDKPL